MSRIDEEMGQRIWALAKQGRSDRAIVAALGPGAPSRATVARYLLSIRGHVRAGKRLQGERRSPPSPPTASPEDPELQVTADVSADVRAAVLEQLDAAETCEAVAAAELALARLDDPGLAALLDPPAIAMLAAGQAVAILSTPQDLADLARLVSEDPRHVIRDEGQSLAVHRREWKAARDADQRRAVELLRAALAIVETSDPPAYPREARP
jgi:hypothetical protein